MRQIQYVIGQAEQKLNHLDLRIHFNRMFVTKVIIMIVESFMRMRLVRDRCL